MNRRSVEPDVQAHQDDLALVQAAAEGDPQSRLCLADRLLDRVRATAFYLCSGKEREDLVQEALVEILTSLGTFRGDSRLETWADRIAVRTMRRGWRRGREGRILPLFDPEQVTAGDLSADRLAHGAELRRALAVALGKLTPERRETFVLFAVHRHTAVELAEMTGAPVNTVRDRIKMARRQLEAHARRDPVLREWLEGGAHEL